MLTPTTEEIPLDNGGKETIVYDKRHLPIKIVDRDTDGNITTETEYIRDELGVNKETTVTRGDGTVIGRFKYNYNELGTLASIEEFDAAGNLMNTTNYELPASQRGNKKAAKEVMDSLTDEEKKILQKRFGIDDKETTE